MNNYLVITHANCNDGWWAANACRLALGDDVEVFYATYQAPPPDVTDRDVVMVDFSYKRPVLLEMKDKARSMIVLDHHKTAEEDLAGLDFCIFNGQESGATMAWEHFFPNKPVPALLYHTKQYDLWLFDKDNKSDYTKRIVKGMYSMCNKDSIKRELCALEDDIEGTKLLADYINAGETLLKEEDKNVESLIRRAMGCTIGHWPYGVAVNTTTAISSLGEALSKDKPYALIWAMQNDGMILCSFRSNENNPDAVDVSEICKSYGGGGHKNAAGCKADMKTLLGWLNL
jgi:oligoribonuclease NrnB/cAMP/cGMP phosphodiesterase (DHH superfamily)